MDLFSNLLIGIVGGIIASGIIGLSIAFFKKIILPKIEEIIYKGRDISGEWKGIETNEEGLKFGDYNLSIIQSGHNINGDLYIKSIHPSKEDTSYYTFKGVIQDNVLHIMYGPKSKKLFELVDSYSR